MFVKWLISTNITTFKLCLRIKKIFLLLYIGISIHCLFLFCDMEKIWCKSLFPLEVWMISNFRSVYYDICFLSFYLFCFFIWLLILFVSSLKYQVRSKIKHKVCILHLIVFLKLVWLLMLHWHWIFSNYLGELRQIHIFKWKFFICWLIDW